MKKIITFIALAFFFSSCEPPGAGMGPCVHIFEEPVLTIESIASAESGNVISKVDILDVKVDSASVYFYLLKGSVSKNITFEDPKLICTVPCGSGTEHGTYQFTVSAERYNDAVFSSQASYTNNKGGCPSSSSGGRKISITLQPE